jgi:pyruvate dehydrogenase E1 component alpha subunit
VVVDGNDVVAVHQAAAVAVARARAGHGPTLIECKTYRQRAHTERKGQPDPRAKDEIASWTARDPITLLAQRLLDAGDLDDAGLAAMEFEVMGALDRAVAFADASPFPTKDQATDDVFAA